MAKSLHTPEYEHFCSLLVAARQKAGLTQVEVALRVKRPQSFVAKYEGCERRLDVIEFLEICDALNVEPSKILAQLRHR